LCYFGVSKFYSILECQQINICYVLYNNQKKNLNEQIMVTNKLKQSRNVCRKLVKPNT